MFRSFSGVSVIGLFFPKASVGIMPYIVLLQEMILVLWYSPVGSNLIWLQLFLRSVLFRFRRSHVPATLFVS